MKKKIIILIYIDIGLHCFSCITSLDLVYQTYFTMIYIVSKFSSYHFQYIVDNYVTIICRFMVLVGSGFYQAWKKTFYFYAGMSVRISFQSGQSSPQYGIFSWHTSLHFFSVKKNKTNKKKTSWAFLFLICLFFPGLGFYPSLTKENTQENKMTTKVK